MTRLAAIVASIVPLAACIAETETLGTDRQDPPTPGGQDCEADPDSEACAPACSTRLFGALTAIPAAQGSLVEVSMHDGSLTEIGTISAEHGRVRGMTYSRKLGTIYAIGRSLNQPSLLQIQVDTGRVREIGPLRPSDPLAKPFALAEGLAYSPCDDELYLSAGERLYFSHALYRVDRRTAEAEYVDPIQLGNDGDALVFVDCELRILDTASGEGTSYMATHDMVNGGVIFKRHVYGRVLEDLAWDAVDERLFGAASADGQLLRLDLEAENRDEVIGTTHDPEEGIGLSMGALVAVDDCAP